MENYRNALVDFIEIINGTIEKMGKEYEPIEIDDYEKTVFMVDWYGDYTEDEAEIHFSEPLSHEEYMNVCKEIMNRAFEDPVWAMHQQFFFEDIQEYARSFAEKLKAEWKCFSGIDLSHVQIYFTTDCARDDNGKPDYKTAGDYRAYFESITINNADYVHEEKVKQSTRHEIIHFMLKNAGMPFDDDSAFFWFFAHIYDASPYKKMNEENEEMYKLMIDIYHDGKRKDDVELAFQNGMKARGEDAEH